MKTIKMIGLSIVSLGIIVPPVQQLYSWYYNCHNGQYAIWGISFFLVCSIISIVYMWGSEFEVMGLSKSQKEHLKREIMDARRRINNEYTIEAQKPMFIQYLKNRFTDKQLIKMLIDGIIEKDDFI